MSKPRPSLDSLGLKYQTDKSSLKHGYLDFYQRFLEELRDQTMRVLDIGVYDGSSARMWEEYFPNATIVAIDINPDCRKHAAGRVVVEILDQSDTVALAELARNHGPFGLVVDDGSHVWNHQITSIRHLFPHVTRGGYYILEDIDTSYGDYVERFRGTSQVSAAAYLQRLSAHVVAHGHFNPAASDDEFLTSCTRITEFVAFSRRTSILRRRAPG